MRKRNFKGVVYMIVNCVNGRKYIGRDSKNQPNYMGGGKNIRLAQEKYGKENFIKITIRKCKDLGDLIYWEQYYLNLYDAAHNPRCYNCTNIAGDGGSLNGKVVHKYKISGEYVESFDTISSAANKYGVSLTAIHNVLIGKNKTSCGFFWSFTKKDALEVVSPRWVMPFKNNAPKPVYYYDMSGNFMGGFRSVHSAEIATGISTESIYYSCKHLGLYPNRKHDFLFSFDKVDKLNVQEIKFSFSRPVIQLTRNGEFVKEYGSIVDAAKAIGLTHSPINHALSGRAPTAGGYKWKYKEVAV